jgi:hypothetical protein
MGVERVGGNMARIPGASRPRPFSLPIPADPSNGKNTGKIALIIPLQTDFRSA